MGDLRRLRIARRTSLPLEVIGMHYERAIVVGVPSYLQWDPADRAGHRLERDFPDLAGVVSQATQYGQRCVAYEVSLRAACDAGVNGLGVLGAALDRLRSAPVLERHGFAGVLAFRHRLGPLVEQTRQAASVPRVLETDQISHVARAVAAVYWALDRDAAIAAAEATYEALFAGCERQEIADIVGRVALEQPPT